MNWIINEDIEPPPPLVFTRTDVVTESTADSGAIVKQAMQPNRHERRKLARLQRGVHSLHAKMRTIQRRYFP